MPQAGDSKKNVAQVSPEVQVNPKTDEGRRRVLIEGVTPEVDAGRFPAKRTVSDLVRVEADIFTDGHDFISAVLLFRPEDSADWTETPMQPLVNDRWFAGFPVTKLGRYRYTIHAWVDHWETWRRDLLKRIAANTASGPSIFAKQRGEPTEQTANDC